ncbi:hypothetical protein CERZMDRAFT_90385 [Cercospora zeae-maydis SCOH1-5]|uniref:Uncharacterized protein n=1 Tax=Cercospora zeae-maydis SCOH1-5 TaxID=717836 RepID=A0A6A6FKN3_9PEZI|nr:hypothetical protein CERZMDRAFT_90385 [Cercospora zeae-maydis SCOH1-5]
MLPEHYSSTHASLYDTIGCGNTDNRAKKRAVAWQRGIMANSSLDSSPQPSNAQTHFTTSKHHVSGSKREACSGTTASLADCQGLLLPDEVLYAWLDSDNVRDLRFGFIKRTAVYKASRS